ncbi:hypothetical protein MP228_008323 [Amoeboaphelidium protococcarum]|nr:hypothetical protein MP228_008323 [Amoeboaphelidium protococcarum]
MAQSVRVRQDSHSGSWYLKDQNALSSQLNGWLDNQQSQLADASNNSEASVSGSCVDVNTLGLIGPHAGYSYSGRCASHGYSQLCRGMNSTQPLTIYVLGPSHYLYLQNRCALTQCQLLKTPLGTLRVNTEITEQLYNSKHFDLLSQSQDEEEHSIEMHLPYIVAACIRAGYKCDADGVLENVSIVPIVVGHLDNKSVMDAYAFELSRCSLNAQSLQSQQIRVIVSSDFCHYGKRFRYTPFKERIHSNIVQMDHDGMKLIENQDLDGFLSYLDTTGNTICGRYPICILLSWLNLVRDQDYLAAINVKFVNYDQSNECNDNNDSSVSYATATIQY